VNSEQAGKAAEIVPTPVGSLRLILAAPVTSLLVGLVAQKHDLAGRPDDRTHF
jgi:hypothetical protein